MPLPFVHVTVFNCACAFIAAGLSSTVGYEKGFRSVGVTTTEASFRFSDRGHTELIDQYEKEQSLDEIVGEYVHPEGHLSQSIADRRKIDLTYSVLASNGDERFGIDKSDDTLTSITDKSEAHIKMRYNNDGGKLNRHFSSKHKRDVRTIVDYRPKHFRVKKNKNDDGEKLVGKEQIVFKKSSPKNDENSKNGSEGESRAIVRNSTKQISLGPRNFDEIRATDTPWPLIPGPISCELDFQLRPSFVANLGEFDYVVSVQLQRSPDEPADHACTGVVYNPRFIVFAPHCLKDNYGLTVTSTDDLCTIDEMIDVDYIIEHENYDPETRINDIALIKLKSEIHKKSAKFPKEDGSLGQHFYAVGFGELMWRSFPDKMSKLLQKVPVRRYSSALKEAPGTLHITTSHMDLTGAFRGDFGGALINLRGEFVGLKSKLVKKSTDHEVYTRVRTYLPWIQSMVTLHGSW